MARKSRQRMTPRYVSALTIERFRDSVAMVASSVRALEDEVAGNLVVSPLVPAGTWAQRRPETLARRVRHARSGDELTRGRRCSVRGPGGEAELARAAIQVARGAGCVG